MGYDTNNWLTLQSSKKIEFWLKNLFLLWTWIWLTFVLLLFSVCLMVTHFFFAPMPEGNIWEEKTISNPVSITKEQEIKQLLPTTTPSSWLPLSNSCHFRWSKALSLSLSLNLSVSLSPPRAFLPWQPWHGQSHVNLMLQLLCRPLWRCELKNMVEDGVCRAIEVVVKLKTRLEESHLEGIRADFDQFMSCSCSFLP